MPKAISMSSWQRWNFHLTSQGDATLHESADAGLEVTTIDELYRKMLIGGIILLIYSSYRASLPAPMFTRSDFSVWSILKKCIGLVS